MGLINVTVSARNQKTYVTPVNLTFNTADFARPAEQYVLDTNKTALFVREDSKSGIADSNSVITYIVNLPIAKFAALYPNDLFLATAYRYGAQLTTVGKLLLFSASRIVGKTELWTQDALPTSSSFFYQEDELAQLSLYVVSGTPADISDKVNKQAINAQNIYVDSNALTEGSGEFLDPFRTITAARDYIVAIGDPNKAFAVNFAPSDIGYGAEVVGTLSWPPNASFIGVIPQATGIGCPIGVTASLGQGVVMLNRNIAFNGGVIIDMALASFCSINFSNGAVGINRIDSNTNGIVSMTGGIFDSIIEGGIIEIQAGLLFGNITVKSGAVLYANDVLLFGGKFLLEGTAILKTLSTLNPQAGYVDGTTVGLDTPVWITDAASNETYTGTITKTIYGGSGIGGSGTLNYVPKFTPDGVTLGNSQIFDDGTSAGIGATTTGYRWMVTGNSRFLGASVYGSPVSDIIANKINLDLAYRIAFDGLDALYYDLVDDATVLKGGANQMIKFLGGAEMARITRSGTNVYFGIGTTTGSTPLTVYKTNPSAGALNEILTLGYANYGNVVGDALKIDFGGLGFNTIETFFPSGGRIGFLFKTRHDGVTYDSLRINTNGGLQILDGITQTDAGTSAFSVKANGETATYAALISGFDTSSTKHIMELRDGSAGVHFRVRNDGRMRIPLVQTGNAGLSSGDVYFDTAANALANGDLVMIRKV